MRAYCLDSVVFVWSSVLFLALGLASCPSVPCCAIRCTASLTGSEGVPLKKAVHPTAQHLPFDIFSEKTVGTARTPVRIARLQIEREEVRVYIG